MPFLFVPVHLWSLQLWPLNLAFLTHTTPSWIWPHFYMSYFATQRRRTPSNFFTSSMLSHWFPIKLELFWREVDYTSAGSHSLWPCLLLSCALSHTTAPPQLFCCLYWPCLCYLFLTRVSLSYFGILVLRVSVRDGEEVYTMNNSWCGFLVSETDGGDGELALRSFFPITCCS